MHGQIFIMAFSLGNASGLTVRHASGLTVRHIALPLETCINWKWYFIPVSHLHYAGHYELVKSVKIILSQKHGVYNRALEIE